MAKMASTLSLDFVKNICRYMIAVKRNLSRNSHKEFHSKSVFFDYSALYQKDLKNNHFVNYVLTNLIPDNHKMF